MPKCEVCIKRFGKDNATEAKIIAKVSVGPSYGIKDIPVCEADWNLYKI